LPNTQATGCGSRLTGDGEHGVQQGGLRASISVDHAAEPCARADLPAAGTCR
jgi:hypothetical protein